MKRAPISIVQESEPSLFVDIMDIPGMSSQASLFTDTKDIVPPVDQFFAGHLFCSSEAAASSSVDYEGVSTLVCLARRRKPDLYPVYFPFQDVDLHWQKMRKMQASEMTAIKTKWLTYKIALAALTWVKPKSSATSSSSSSYGGFLYSNDVKDENYNYNLIHQNLINMYTMSFIWHLNTTQVLLSLNFQNTRHLTPAPMQNERLQGMNLRSFAWIFWINDLSTHHIICIAFIY